MIVGLTQPLGACSKQEGSAVSTGLYVQDDGEEVHRLFPDVDFDDCCFLLRVGTTVVSDAYGIGEQ